MKTRVIPTTENPWMCKINGVMYSYPAGSTKEVPDEVAELIDNISAELPKPAPSAELPKPAPSDVGKVWTMAEAGAEWEKFPMELPAWSNGKFLKSSSTGCSWASLPTATKTVNGAVKMAAKVDDATSETIVTQFNALIDALIAAGVLEDNTPAS